MAADATFNQSTGGNYQKHGGNHWVVGGTLEILPGGVIDMSTAGTLKVGLGGVIDMSTGGGVIRHYVETGTTTAALKAYGTSIVTKTSAGGNQVYTMDAPIAGVEKRLVCLAADSSDKVSVDFAASGATLHAAAGGVTNQIVFATSATGGLPAGACTLLGESTSQWVITSAFGTIATTS